MLQNTLTDFLALISNIRASLDAKVDQMIAELAAVGGGGAMTFEEASELGNLLEEDITAILSSLQPVLNQIDGEVRATWASDPDLVIYLDALINSFSEFAKQVKAARDTGAYVYFTDAYRMLESLETNAQAMYDIAKVKAPAAPEAPVAPTVSKVPGVAPAKPGIGIGTVVGTVALGATAFFGGRWMWRKWGWGR